MPDNKYIVNGRVERHKIVSDIANRRITHDELLAIISDPIVRESFIGQSFAEKIPENEWSSDYLQKLTVAVINDAFNEDYLLYLEEVASYVAKHSNGKKRVNDLLIIVVAAVALALVVVLIVAFSSKR